MLSVHVTTELEVAQLSHRSTYAVRLVTKQTDGGINSFFNTKTKTTKSLTKRRRYVIIHTKI